MSVQVDELSKLLLNSYIEVPETWMKQRYGKASNLVGRFHNHDARSLRHKTNQVLYGKVAEIITERILLKESFFDSISHPFSWTDTDQIDLGGRRGNYQYDICIKSCPDEGFNGHRSYCIKQQDYIDPVTNVSILWSYEKFGSYYTYYCNEIVDHNLLIANLNPPSSSYINQYDTKGNPRFMFYSEGKANS
jgi:hypothetical protein